TASWQLLTTLRGHTGVVWSVAFSRDGQLLASGGDDGMLRLWQTGSNVGWRTLRADRRYERLDITGLSGVTEAQRVSLLALGAVERPGHSTMWQVSKQMVEGGTRHSDGKMDPTRRTSGTDGCYRSDGGAE
ncbi:MAG: hypothetical protein JO023_20020, partial [Chloroflexi bacterium]|nr:hypothetical protein [Chloroflexota bacterium]